MGTLVKAAVFPTLEVVLMCSVGAVLSWTGKVNAEQRKFLSNLVMFLFVPCIIFEKLGSSISMENLVTWWPFTAHMMTGLAAGVGVGYMLIWALRVPRHQWGLVIVITSIPNAGNLPLVLVSSICASASNPFGAACERDGVAYVAMGMFIVTMYMWSGGYYLMSPPLDGHPPTHRCSATGSALSHAPYARIHALTSTESCPWPRPQYSPGPPRTF